MSLSRRQQECDIYKYRGPFAFETFIHPHARLAQGGGPCAPGGIGHGPAGLGTRDRPRRSRSAPPPLPAPRASPELRCGAAELGCGAGSAVRGCGAGAAVRFGICGTERGCGEGAAVRCRAVRCGAVRSGGCSAGSAVRGCGAELRCGAGLLGALPPCGLARPVAMGPAPPLRARHPPPSRSRRLAGRGRGLQGAPANLNSLLLFLSPKSGGRNCRRSAPAPAPGLSPLLCGARQRRRRR